MSFKRHVGAYTVIGAVQWVVDYLVTVALSRWVMPLELANICGQLSGALLGYSTGSCRQSQSSER